MPYDMRRRTWLGAAAALAAGPALAQNDAYPRRPLTLVVCFPPGGSSDTLARPLAAKLAAALGQPVNLDHRGGAGGTTGAATVARSAGDGHTLMLTSSHHLIAEHVYKKLPYRFAAAFEPVAVIASVPSVLVVGRDSKINSVRELIAAARGQQLRYGSAGIGSTQQATAELFRFRTGAAIEHVPFKGGGPMMADLAAGAVDLAFETIPSAMVQIRAGKVKALAVTTDRRSFALPDAPTLAEAGVPGFDVPVWYGVSAPKGTPRVLIDRLNATINGILDNAEFKAQLLRLGALPVTMSPLQWSGAVRLDLSRWDRLVRLAGMATA
ncbi:MAG: tripartite tricarboxylate transporter substrate binding protein [Rubrivivax sp.]|nr:tripartite tricarboxylate transporter substrate binding protein [Rubrivivax sp.]